MGCWNAKISRGNSLVLGAIQIMIGIFHVFMWYFLLVLYMGQIKGVFGKYEPLTYQTGSALWGVFFIMSGAFTIRSTKYPTRTLIIIALTFNILSIIVSIIALVLTIVELASFETVSYRNYGQAKLGREVSRILLASYPVELSITLTYSICSCAHLKRNTYPLIFLLYLSEKMPQDHLWVKEEMRVMGVIQISTGLILNNLGMLWTYLLLTQLPVFGPVYIPLTILTGYPFWSSFSFILSGTFAVVVERRRSLFWMSYTIGVTIMSTCSASLGVLILAVELAIYGIPASKSIWPHKSGALLSVYLLIFTILELFVATKVIEWVHEAKSQR